MEIIFTIFSIIIFFYGFTWISDIAEKLKKYNNLKPRLDNIEAREIQFRQEQLRTLKSIEAREVKLRQEQLERIREIETREAKIRQEQLEKIRELETREAKFRQEQLEYLKKIDEEKQVINNLAQEKSVGFPWLAQAYADYFSLKELEIADYLESKPRPARKTAENIRELTAKFRNAEKLWRVLDYQIKYYENLFPWLVDYKEENIDELIKQLSNKKVELEASSDEQEDPARQWLTKAEYESLPTIEKYQLALERYWSKKKAKWEIGRDYERYIGYLYEINNCQVYYQGIIDGLSDLGRDLVISSPNGKVEIIQCKYWSQEKMIHEKHIFQLYGTLVAYQIDNPKIIASATLFTSTILSETAKKFAKALNVKYFEKQYLQRYPCIKCNISSRGKIYHLPFDQQYDKVIINKEKKECYVWTVKEAESLNFRRAFKWRGRDKE
jgi:hypothetical protein